MTCDARLAKEGPMAATKVHHPLFARLYNRMSAVAEAKGAAEHRREALSGLRGRVIEIGAGNGHNFRHYPNTVTEVVAVEPERFLRSRAEEAAVAADVPITIHAGTADALPAETASCAAAVFSLVLCSVPDQAAALQEAMRVVRPGGEIRLFEHVVAQTRPMTTMQRGIDLVWPLLGGGCHTSRDTPTAVTDAGFEIEQLRRFMFAPCLLTKPAEPHIIAVARRPA